MCFSDMVYCGVYDNALDNDNYNLARGFNYHQGPVSVTEPTTTLYSRTSADQEKMEHLHLNTFWSEGIVFFFILMDQTHNRTGHFFPQILST